MSRADEEGSGHVTVDQIYQAALEIGINTDRQIDEENINILCCIGNIIDTDMYIEYTK